MNPQLDPPHGLHLPQPAHTPPQQAAPSGAQQQVGQQAPIQSPPMQYAYMPPAPAPAAPSIGHTVSQGESMMRQVDAQEMAGSDDSGAHLDEQWVDKAKELVGRYGSDPYSQSRELSKLKAEYLKARYNKEIKVSKDQP